MELSRKSTEPKSETEVPQWFLVLILDLLVAACLLRALVLELKVD